MIDYKPNCIGCSKPVDDVTFDMCGDIIVGFTLHCHNYIYPVELVSNPICEEDEGEVHIWTNDEIKGAMDSAAIGFHNDMMETN